MGSRRDKNLVWLLAVTTLVLGQLTLCKSQNSSSAEYCNGEQSLQANETVQRISSHSSVNVSMMYLDNMNCSWLIQASPGEKIVAWFSYLDVQSPYDKVTLQDGTNGTVMDVVSQSGYSPYDSPRYMSSSNFLSVRFTTDSSVRRFGFVLEYKAVRYNTSASTCGKFRFTNSLNTSALIASHDLYDGSTPYSPNISCVWHLPNLMNAWTIFAVTIDSASIGSGDCLRLYVGTPLSGISTHYAYCGWSAIRNVKRELHSSDRIEFHSDGTFESSGFKITIQRNYSQYCTGTIKLQADESVNEITSHLGVGVSQYTHLMFCYWNIWAPPRDRIVAWITYMDLEDCCDRVFLIDAENSAWYQRRIDYIGEYAPSHYAPIRYMSTSNVMTVFFNTDSSGHRLGFKLQYKTFRDSGNATSCGSMQFTSSSNASGLIRSHELYDEYVPYPPNTHCLWYLPELTDNSTDFNVTIEHASIGSGDCLKLARGSRFGYSEFALYCGWTGVRNVSHQMRPGDRIEFYSNQWIESSGFLLTFYKDQSAATGSPNVTTPSTVAGTEVIAMSSESDKLHPTFCLTIGLGIVLLLVA